jgi:hypothetical protein
MPFSPKPSTFQCTIFNTNNALSYDELMKNYTVDYIAGGAAQNTIRAAQVPIELF